MESPEFPITSSLFFLLSFVRSLAPDFPPFKVSEPLLSPLLQWWISKCWNALGFHLGLYFSCTHLTRHHLDSWLEINLYGNDPRYISLEFPLASRFMYPDTTFISLLGCLKSNPRHNNSHLTMNWLLGFVCLLACFINCPSPKSESYPWFLSFLSFPHSATPTWIFFQRSPFSLTWASLLH